MVQQRTDFPCADTTRLVIKGGSAFDLTIRVPRWGTRGVFVTFIGRD